MNLGSVTVLPASVDFNTDNIYLGIKVGADAEMTPRVQFTAVPQAFNSEKLGGLDKTGYIQNTTSQQASSNFNISGIGIVGTSLTTPLVQSAANLTIAASGANSLLFQTNGLTRLTIDGSGNSTMTGTLTVQGAGLSTINGSLSVGGNVTMAGGTLNPIFNGIIGAAAGWFKLGTVSLAQSGAVADIKLYGGSGYNASASQDGTGELIIRAGNGSSTGPSGFGASAVLTRYGQTAAFASDVKLVSNVAGAAATSYDVYIYNGTFIGNGFYRVDLSNAGGNWIPSVSTAADPGVNSSTVFDVPQEFRVLNTLNILNNSVSVTGTLAVSSNLSQTAGSTISAGTGYKINGAAAIGGTYLRGDGTNFVGSTIQAADLPTGSGNYIQNGTVLQTANFNISGNGQVGGTLAVTGAVTSGTVNGQTISSAANLTGTLNVASSLSVGGTGVITQGGNDVYANIRVIRSQSTAADGMYINYGGSGGSAKIFDGGTANHVDVTAGGNLTTNGGTITSGLINGQTLSSAANFTGTVNAATGYQLGGLAATGNYLRGNGTNFVSSAIQAADIPSGSGNYIQNQNLGAQAAANFNISGAGTLTTLNVNGVIYGQSVALAGDVLAIGNDSKLVDINVANTAGLYGIQDSTVGGVKLGSGGPTLFGQGGKLGIGTITPGQLLDVQGGNINTSGNVISAGALIEKSVTFTPTTIGWYRVLAGSGTTGGVVRAKSSYDNAITDLELSFNIGGYGTNGSIQQTRFSSYNQGVISQARISTDNGANVYLDLYVYTATTPGPITLYGYGPNMQAFTASPVVGAVAGPTNVNTLTMGHGLRTTAGANFAETAGNVGIGTAAPAQKLDVQGGSINTSGSILTGGTIRLDNAGNLNNIGTIAASGAVTAGTYNGQTISSAASFTGTVLAATSISAPQLISTIASGTAPLTVTSSTLVNNLNVQYLNGYSENQLASNLRSNVNISGGGTVAFNGGISWTNRFIVISNGNGADSSINGYFDIFQPANASVITGVGGHANATVAGGVVPMSAWDALYYVLPIGSGAGTVNANFRIATYGGALQIPSNWVLVALLNGDNNTLRLGTGLTLRSGQTMTAGTIDNPTFNSSATSPTLNATSSFQLNGVNINTAGTLNNLAYLNQANTFSAAGTALTVNNNASIGGTLAVTTFINTPVVLINNASSAGGQGIRMAYATSTPNSGPSIQWSDGTLNNDLGLYVNGGLIFQGNAGNPDFKVYAPTTNGALGTEIVHLGGASTTANSYFNGGNFGIGTAGPGYKLDVQAGDINTSAFYRQAGNIVLNTTTATANTFLGSGAGNTSATGANNTATGNAALQANTTGIRNTANGSSALNANSTGSNNTSTGAFSLQNNTASNNTANGTFALQFNTGGNANTASGIYSLLNNQTGSNNTAVGASSLVNTTAGNNTAIGASSLFSNVGGSNNTAIGINAGYQDNGGTFSTGASLQNATAIGAFAQVQASNSVVLGSVDLATKVGIGTTVATNVLSVNPLDSAAGTAGTGGVSSTTVTGVGTAFTGAMVGEQFIFDDGQNSFISGVASGTSLTLTSALTEAAGHSYRIHRTALEVNSTGNVSIGTTNTYGQVDLGGTNANYNGINIESTLTNTTNNLVGLAINSKLQAANGYQAIGAYVAPSFLTTAGQTIQDARGISIETPYKLGTGTITNSVGLYVRGDTGAIGTNNYSILVNSGISQFNGAVGVGATPTTSKVVVNTNNASTIGQIIQGVAGQTADLLQLQNSSGTTLAKIDASGNVGIGTLSPNAKLEVDATLTTPALLIKGTGETVLNYTGASQTYVVPAGVTSLSIETRGAAGGDSYSYGVGDYGIGGRGAKVTSIITVTPGETLNIYVGGRGVNGANTVSGNGAGGFNGGGTGGAPGDPGGQAAGGGGATDVRQSGTALANRVIVAGGGGGATPVINGGGVGAVGGDSGQTGIDGGNAYGPTLSELKGKGATQSAGGAAAGGSCSPASTAGTLGNGGAGGSALFYNNGEGGGGGGGYYGGSGGTSQNAICPGVVYYAGGGGGGGGSSYATGSGIVYQTGVQAGNGTVVIRPQTANHEITQSGSGNTLKVIDAAGNFGIGTATPGASLHVNGSSDNTTFQGMPYNMILSSTNAQNEGAGSGILFQGSYLGATQATFAGISGVKENGLEGNNAGALLFGTRVGGGTLTEKVRITSDGRVGIGAGTNINSLLQVAGTVTIGIGSPTTVGVMQLTTGGTSPINNRLQYGTDGSGWKFAISKNQAGTITDQLVIQDNNNVCIGVPSCNSKLGVAGSIGASGAITASTTPDIAETIAAADDVTAADVVMADPTATERVVKTTGAYSGAAVGVISDGTSSFMINAYAHREGGPLTGKPLVLAGRVPVKITNEGGAVMPGDYLTSSSTPGYAMKAAHAGPTIGKALGFFDGNQATGTVLALINVSYYGPSANDNIQANNATLNSLTVNGGMNAQSINIGGLATLGSLKVTGSATIAGNLNVGGDLTVTGVTRVADITVNGHIITAGNNPTPTVMTALGMGATVVVKGNDTSGSITITTGQQTLSPTVGSDPTVGELAAINFAKQYGAPVQVSLTPMNGAAADMHYFVGGDQQKFTLSSTTLPAKAQTYVFSYFVRQ